MNDPRIAAYQSELTAWAIAYAARGWPVFPCGPDKRPRVKWSKQATKDARQIESWWRQWPLAMIAVPTGQRSGLVVLDIDCRGTVDGFATLRAMGFQIPAEAVEVETPSGGRHFWFAANGLQVRNSAGKIGPGVDVRGEGGMVIVPPSRPSIEGASYCFAEGQGVGIGGVRA
jgi:hypothetical protein